MKQVHPVRVIVSGLLTLSTFAIAQDKAAESDNLARKVAEKFAAAKQYKFEGTLELSRKSGEGPMNVLAKAKVKLAMAPGGKYFLRVEDLGKSSYVVVSDGRTSWTYVPALKKYLQHEAAAVSIIADLSGALEDPQLQAPADLIDEYARRVVPMLAILGEPPTATFLNGAAQVNYEGQIRGWPVLTVISKKDDPIAQTLTYLTIDPATLTVGRMLSTRPVPSSAEKVLVRLAITFESFHVDEPIADSEFSFSLPPGAKRADSLPVPKQGGASLLNKPAADFELKNLDGRSIRLGALQGHPVLLAFGSRSCVPCSHELPILSKINEEYKGRGLVSLGIIQDKAADLTKDPNVLFDVLDDSADKVARLYRVHLIPTIFLINAKGTVVRVFPGVPDEKALRAALKSVGL